MNTRTNRSLTLDHKREIPFSHKVSLQLDPGGLPLKNLTKKESLHTIDLDKDLDDYYELDLRQND